MTPQRHPPVPPRYQILDLIGEGGMGRVFKAHDLERQAVVALKVVKARSPADRQRLEAEARALSRLHHEGVVRLFDAGVAGDGIFFTMEVLEGLPLDRVLKEPLPGEDEIQWTLKVCAKVLDALDHVHSSGIIHRDVKPSNVIVLGPDGPRDGASEPAVKILDFGLAREIEGASPASLATVGTPLYMSPEQAHGVARESSDVYSVGAMLYHLIARQPPFTSLTGVLSRKPEPRPPSDWNPACSPEVSRLILDMVEREPHRRPATAGEARRRILSLIDGDDGNEGRGGRGTEPARLLPPVFTGRAAELGAMRQALARASRGDGSVTRVVGERGSGKTWLFQESGIATEALADFGLHPIRGAFHRDGALHAGLRGVFTELVSLLESRDARGSMRGESCPWGAALLRTLGVERGEAPPSHASSPAPAAADDPGSPASRVARDAMLEASAGILRAAASIQPLFITIEDIQHAGELEIDILGRLARAVRGQRVALAVTFRPYAGDGDRASKALAQWNADLELDGAAPPIALGTLTDGEIQTLVERRLRPHADAAPELVSALASRSEGNPLSLARWTQALFEKNAIRCEGGQWKLSAAGAASDASWQSSWPVRIAALDPRDLALLASSWVLGGPVDEELIGRTAGPCVDEIDLRARIRCLAKDGLILSGPEGFAPVPELDERDADGASPAAAVLSERAGRALLSELHLRAAEALLERGGAGAGSQLFRIATHFARAGKAGRASEMYLAAARQMASTFANGRARESYLASLEGCESPDAARRIHEEIGDLCARIGDYPAALEHLRRCLPVGLPGSSVLDKIGRVLHRQGEIAEALSVFSRCLEEAGSDISARARALFRVGGIHLDRGDAAAAQICLEESLGLFESLGDWKQAAAVQFSLGVAEKSQNRLEKALGRFEGALESAERSGSSLEAAMTLNNLGNVYRAIGDDSRAVECLRKSIAVRERIGDRQGLAICLNNIARVQSHRGDLVAARESTERALRIFEEIGDKKGVLIARLNLGEALHQLGALELARSLLVSCVELAEKLKAQRLLESALCNLGALELDRGEHDAAREHLVRCLRSLPADKPLEIRVQALGLLAGVALGRHDLEGAGDALREAIDMAGELHLKEKLHALISQDVRFHVERGEPEKAIAAGKPLLATANGADRMGLALLHLEMGRAYRELGPDWADRTERELGAALRAFESMKCPHHAARARVEMALYWRLLGEDAEAARLLRDADEEMRRLDAPRRIEEIAALRGSSA